MKRILAMMMAVALCLGAIGAAAEGTGAQLSVALFDEAQREGMEAIAKAYMDQNKDVTIEVQVSSPADYWTALEGGELPDVFALDGDHFVMYADAGMLLPLDFEHDYSPYPEGLVDMYSLDGTQYAMPFTYESVALAYNKTLFDAAGEAYPDDSWTWETLQAAAGRLTDGAGVYGFGAPNELQTGYYPFIYQNGGFVFNPADRTSGFSMPQTVEAVQAWVDMAGKVSPSVDAFTTEDALAQFMAGKLAMLFVSSRSVDTLLADDAFAGQFDLAPLPAGEQQATMYTGQGLSGSATVENAEAVKAFIAFCGSEEANQLMAEHKGAIPAYAGTEGAYVEQFDVNMGSFVEMYAYGVCMPYDRTLPLWEDYVRMAVAEAYDGKKTVEEACLQIHEYISDMVISAE